ncbi:hypothetical protein F442_15347 [Phytophthora nicotianae P10297]|uniref:Uncharacterized protein n=2 Tax=Phytophthora nicotianae TaxID=4792 RepID=W2R1L7_PHYN3|nr:hypothetical protein PPTG_21427 [Phytophthora nicotianae INRA-310]ETN19171.1 hypothetical protein PPTG_21427 [Phytophthora nicotianae INRA-310]ETP36787.1 hypothetical protein F442_15347 [Phytophthora nicotianae P10297]
MEGTWGYLVVDRRVGRICGPFSFLRRPARYTTPTLRRKTPTEHKHAQTLSVDSEAFVSSVVQSGSSHLYRQFVVLS